MDDNFFDLAATSLHLIQVHGRLREALGVEVPVLELFRNPTIAALARHVQSASGGQRAPRDGEPREVRD